MLFEVDMGEDGQRIDNVLKGRFLKFSRSSLQKSVRQHGCLVDGVLTHDPAQKVNLKQRIEFKPPEEKATISPETGEVYVLWQDRHFAVCLKPPGLTVHPCPSCAENTFAQRLLTRFPQLLEQQGQRPGIVHRLDKDTSGLIIVALTEEARLRLIDAFANRRINKEYLAIVAGNPPATGEIAASIGRHTTIKTKMAIVPEKKGGKPAFSSWRNLWTSPDEQISLLEVAIGTGRTHQIRVHMSHLGFPILGDQLYAPAAIRTMAPRQMLHAWKLGMRHPFTGQMLSFTAPPPPDFTETIMRLNQTTKRIIITGNPGCGKSTLREELEQAGVPAISADGIVATLYTQKPNHVAAWLETRGFANVIDRDGKVDKSLLFPILESDADLRHEFEKYIHALVGDEISSFWHHNKDKLLAVAEIPLYFESGMQKILSPSPLCVGVHCSQEERWKRLRHNRGWNDEKIAAIEKWQLPEGKKMDMCDVVIDNTGSRSDLQAKARDFLGWLKELNEVETKDFLREITDIYGKPEARIAQE